MGTFGRLVFCEVRTQIVGKTQFFDSLKEHLFSLSVCDILIMYSRLPERLLILYIFMTKRGHIWNRPNLI